MQVKLERTINGLAIERILSELSLKRATGELLITREEQEWTFYFVLGYLRYATGGNQRTRRWYRALKQNCPTFTGIQLASLANEDPWEYQLISQGLKQELVNYAQAKGIITSSIQEILFSLYGSERLVINWVTKKQPTTPLNLLIRVEEAMEPVKTHAHNLSLFKVNLNQYNPEMSAILKPSANVKVSPTISRFFQGTHPLWDVALEVKRPITDIIRALLPLDKQGLLKLKELDDLSAPVPNLKVSNLAEAPTTVKEPLIACIDDSLAMCQTIEKIIIKGGYRVLTIQNVLEDMSTLVKQKPDLILLDLMMPDVNGYNLCNFLRQTQAFQDTPIIILTSSNDSVDRMMTEIAGATGFLNKPPEEKIVLETIKKHLPKPTSPKNE